MVAARKFGWTPDALDQRDRFSVMTASRYAAHPPKLSLVDDSMPPIFQQGNLGSCVAQACGAVYEFIDRDSGTDNYFRSSRLFIYYNARVLMGSAGWDSGCYIRDAMKSLNQKGSLDETRYPYQISKFANKPTPSVYTQALAGRIDEYARVLQNIEQIKEHLVNRRPIVFGASVYESFLSDKVSKSGMVPLPKVSEALAGGHAMAIVGYDDNLGCYEIRNSWGALWGIDGYCFMPYNYLHSPKLCSDFWVMYKTP